MCRVAVSSRTVLWRAKHTEMMNWLYGQAGEAATLPDALPVVPRPVVIHGWREFFGRSYEKLMDLALRITHSKTMALRAQQTRASGCLGAAEAIHGARFCCKTNVVGFSKAAAKVSGSRG